MIWTVTEAKWYSPDVELTCCSMAAALAIPGTGTETLRSTAGVNDER